MKISVNKKTVYLPAGRRTTRSARWVEKAGDNGNSSVAVSNSSCRGQQFTNRRSLIYFICLFVFGATAPPPSGPGPPHSRGFLYHTQWRTTVGRTPLDEWSARRRGLYLHNTQHSQQISMPSVGFEPTISASERPQTWLMRKKLSRCLVHIGK